MQQHGFVLVFRVFRLRRIRAELPDFRIRFHRFFDIQRSKLKSIQTDGLKQVPVAVKSAEIRSSNSGFGAGVFKLTHKIAACQLSRPVDAFGLQRSQHLRPWS